MSRSNERGQTKATLQTMTATVVLRRWVSTRVLHDSSRLGVRPYCSAMGPMIFFCFVASSAPILAAAADWKLAA